MSSNINIEVKSILLWLRDTIPSIRGKVFSILNVELDIQNEHNEMIHTYLEHKSTLLPTQEELKQAVIKNFEYSILMINIDSIYGNKRVNNMNRSIFGKHKNVCYVINDNYYISNLSYSILKNDNEIYYLFDEFGRYGIPSKVEEVILDVENTIRFFRDKSLENNGWYKKHNPNYVSDMTIKYINSVLDGMELYLKISYLLLSMVHIIDFSSKDICVTHNRATGYIHIKNIHPCEDDYNKLYAIVIDYIKDNS